MKLRFLFASMVLFLASTHAFAISNVFTYQGALTDAGNPANGVYDFQFQLKDAANANVGTPITREDVQVSAGVFTVELDFGTAITSSDFKMEIGVRPGASTDPHQVLAPLTALRPSPQAQIAGMAVEAATVSPGGVTNAMLANDAVTSTKLAPGAVANTDLADGAVGASKVVSGEVQLRVGGTCAEGSSVRLINADGTVTCETDDNNAGGVTSVATGAGLTGGPITTSGTIAADTTYLQRRVSSSCAAGSSISAIADDGTVTCETDDTGTGTVSSVASGTGLTGGPITTTGTLSIASGGVTSNMISDGSIVAADVNTTSVQARVSGTCSAGSSVRVINADGTVTCESDDTGTGTVSSVASGTGLTGGPITTTGTLSIASGGVTSNMISDGSIVAADVNTTSVQARVSGTCTAGSSIQSIGTNGSVVCETDDNGTNAWNLTGNLVTNPNTHFIGTADNQPVHIRSNNQNVSRMQANAISLGGFTANIINGSPANNITAGVRGATIAGGGVPTGNSDPSHDFENPNRVTDNYGTVGGGYGNQVGDNNTNLADAPFATVAGGIGNSASGSHGFVGGGNSNQSLGNNSNVAGGLTNTASGDGSNVAGGATNTASGEVSNVAGGSHNAASGFLSNVAGGYTNTASGIYSNVAGGYTNTASGIFSHVAGGESNTASGVISHVTGGFTNTASGELSHVAGGRLNTASGELSHVAGGGSNTASNFGSHVAGGHTNTASGSHSNVTGGQNNTASGSFSTISGGDRNCAGGSHSWAGGRRAIVRPTAISGDPNTGCNSVMLSGDADGDEGTFVWADSLNADFVSSGPDQFLVRASGGVIFNGNALHADSDDYVFYKRALTGNDVDLKLVSLTRAAGIYVKESTGTVGIHPQDLTSGANRLEVQGASGSLTAVMSSGGVWGISSSRNYKEHFVAIDPKAILQKLVDLPITEWQYKGSSEGTHLGPIAEDFKAAFNLAGDGKTIFTVDADGVALAAIQGLNQKLESENAALRNEAKSMQIEAQALRNELNELKAIVHALQATRGE